MLWADLISLTYSVHPKSISSHQENAAGTRNKLKSEIRHWLRSALLTDGGLLTFPLSFPRPAYQSVEKVQCEIKTGGRKGNCNYQNKIWTVEHAATGLRVAVWRRIEWLEFGASFSVPPWGRKKEKQNLPRPSSFRWVFSNVTHVSNPGDNLV